MHWWAGVPNFGDVLSALIVAHVSGRDVVHVKPAKAELFALGSLLQVARRTHKTPRADGVKPWIWGTGLLHSVSSDFVENVRIALVRGPVTAALLGIKPREFGDPGLLVTDLVQDRPETTDRIGIVPHHSQLDDPQIAGLSATDPAVQVIDVRDDALTVCRQIAACRHVVASSLHGLIVADAFGVPNSWMDPGRQSHLKYLDYAASIGRPLTLPLEIADVPAHLATLKDSDTILYTDAIAQARQALIDSFPAELCAQPDTTPAELAGVTR